MPPLLQARAAPTRYTQTFVRKTTSCQRRQARARLVCTARNRLLFKAKELVKGCCVLPSNDSRHQHLVEVLKVQVGDPVQVGVIGGRRCTAQVHSISDTIELRWQHWQDPLPPAHVHLLLAMPRPRVMKRLWTHLATLGVASIVITGANRVEKTYFSTSRALRSPLVYEDILKGLEQASDTRLPDILVGQRLQTVLSFLAAQQCASGTRPRLPAGMHCLLSSAPSNSMPVVDGSLTSVEAAEPEARSSHSTASPVDGAAHMGESDLQPGPAVAQLANPNAQVLCLAAHPEAELSITDALFEADIMPAGSAMRTRPDRVPVRNEHENRQHPQAEVESSPRHVLLAVGPEGGWTPPELALMRESGFQLVCMGSRPMDTTTAIIALISHIKQLMQDW